MFCFRSRTRRPEGRGFIALLVAVAVLAGVESRAQTTGFSRAEREAVVAALAADGAVIPPSNSDELLRAAMIDNAAKRLGQRLSPPQVDPLWALQPPRHDVAREFDAARSEGRLAGWLQSLDPPIPMYGALQAERRRYAAVAAAGGWAALPSGGVIRPGDPAGPAVASLRERLRLEGYAVGAAAEPTGYDAALQTAVEAFQANHRLDVDGVVGPATRKALDVPVEERLAQFDANLERMRWLPHDLPARRVEVDTGQAELHYFEAGKPVLTMRVVVGDPRHHTPMFTSRLDAVVFNPPWNVPASIAKAEILPKAARDRGYLARNRYVFTSHGLQQLPGPKSALGVLKFDLQSPFGVYLHDTPSRAAFARNVRTLSHGCMRLEAPRDLAEKVLGPQGWTRQRIDEAIAAGATRRVALEITVPLYVVHRTIAIGSDGRAIFWPDAYGWDAKLARALEGAGSSPIMARLATECSASPAATPSVS